MTRLGNAVRALLALLIVAVGGITVHAASYPSRPIKLIVPFAAGGVGDVVARLLGEQARAELGQPLIVDNRPGGNTAVGTEVAARSEPDGYTILQLSPNGVIIESLQKDVHFDIERDFVPIVGVGSFPLALAVPGKSSIHSVADLVAAAKNGDMNYASANAGTVGHLAAVLFTQKAGIKATHVPYRGNVTTAIQDLVQNRVQFYFPNVVDSEALAKSGDIRLLAVTSEKRVAELPNVPTMIELGYTDFNPVVWYGYLAPKGTPPDIVAQLQKAFADAAEKPDVQARLGTFGFVAKVSNGAEFGKLLHTETERWSKVIQDNNIKLEE
jgi:tripartite-type tricarboxylate transporter receptor subunit TctC